MDSDVQNETFWIYRKIYKILFRWNMECQNTLNLDEYQIMYSCAKLLIKNTLLTLFSTQLKFPNDKHT